MRYPTYEQIVSNIRALIEEKGMKQTVVAERSGMTRQQLCDMLNYGRKTIRIEHLPVLADAIGVDVCDIFYMLEPTIKIGDKEYSEIVVTDKDGNLLASITGRNVIEEENCRVTCVPSR